MAAIPDAPAARHEEAFDTRDSANGQHGNGDGAANFGEPLKPLRRAERRLRRRGENGAKKKIIRATSRGCSRSFQRVAGNANEEIMRSAAGIHKPLCFRQRQTVFAKMHATGFLGKRNVQAIVDEYACWSSLVCCGFCCALQRLKRKRSAVFSREVLFANLNPIHAGGRSRCDFAKESFALFRRFDSAKAAAVRHVTEQHAAG